MTIAGTVATSMLSAAASEAVKDNNPLHALFKESNWAIVGATGLSGLLYFGTKKGKTLNVQNSSLKIGSIGLIGLAAYLFYKRRKNMSMPGA